MSKPTYGWKAMCSGFPTTHESFDLGKPFKHYKPITANGPNIRTVLEVTVLSNDTPSLCCSHMFTTIYIHLDNCLWSYKTI